MKKENIIYFLLVTAIFNAVLRVSPDSTITLFRLLIPICFIYINIISKKAFKLLISGSIFLIAIASVQNIFTSHFFFPQVHTISFAHLFNYCIHYVSIFVVATLVYCLWCLNKECFFERIINFSSKLVKFILILYIPYILTGHSPASFLVFGNINDLGCILTGGVVVVIFDKKTKKNYKYLYIILILFLLFYNDSKLAMFGAILELVLYFAYNLSRRFSNAKKIIERALLFSSFVGIFVLLNSNLEINGYPVRDLWYIPYVQFKTGIYFDDVNQSFTFRTNTILGVTEILKNSFGLGVGPGNTSLILKYLIPDPVEAIRQDYISSHIWWYEIMADLGWIVIIPMVLFYFRQWRGYASMKSERMQLFSQIYIITFPIWCMSSSGLYTEFFSIMIIALCVIIYRNSRNNGIKEEFKCKEIKNEKINCTYM